MIDDVNIKQMLERKGQSHLLRYYDILSDREKKTLLSELSKLDFSFFERAERLRQIRSCDISPIDIFTSRMAEQRREELEAAGLAAIGKGRIAAVLLWGRERGSALTIPRECMTSGSPVRFLFLSFIFPICLGWRGVPARGSPFLL